MLGLQIREQELVILHLLYMEMEAPRISLSLRLRSEFITGESLCLPARLSPVRNKTWRKLQ